MMEVGQKCLLLDPVGGASGDMLLAALFDAGASREVVQRAWSAVDPDGRIVAIEARVQRGHVDALRVSFSHDGAASGGADGIPGQQVLDRLRVAPLSPRVSELAGAIFERLLAAEASVHHVERGAVQLHHMGELDTLVDVVGIAAALEDLAVGEMLVPTIRLAVGGTSGAGDRAIPLPAPATLELLKGFPLRLVPGESETVTPTAAAVIAAVGVPAGSTTEMRVVSVGVGAGARETLDRPNVLRAILGIRSVGPKPWPDGPSSGVMRSRPLSILETTIDDLSPQLTADAADGLRALGALDAWLTPVVMKKGRAGYVLSALVESDEVAELTQAFFALTPTLGVRISSLERVELDRRHIDLALASGDHVRIKEGGRLDAPLTLSPEHDDLVAISKRTGRTVRELHTEASALAYLRYRRSSPEDDGDG